MVRKIICKPHCVSNISSFLIRACQFVRFPSFSPCALKKKKEKKKKPGLGKTGEGNSPHSWRHFGCLSLDIKHKPQLWWRHCGGPHLAQLPPSPLFGLNKKNKYEDLYKTPTHQRMSRGCHGWTPRSASSSVPFVFRSPLRRLIHHILRISRFTALYLIYLFIHS